MKAVVFDIRRFSTHDGKGLRTNVFLKGCPLRCVWCQNPEGLEPAPRPVWFATACMGCRTCVACCKHGGVQAGESGLVIDPRASEDWDYLVDECPTGALRMDARVMSVDEVVAEAEKDRIFYRSDGGVTLSGGEPLMQAEFCSELLKALKERGIHTAIETSLFAAPEQVKRVLPLVDQIFCDCKLADQEKHKRFTGVSNKLILQNLAWLLESPLRSRVTVRTPLIPTMTATDENLGAIAQMLCGLYPQVRYELLNYNPLAAAKYRDTERSYCFTDAENPQLYTKDQMRRFGEVVTKNGISNLVLEL